MKLVAGVDIGNSTTEVCIGRLEQTGLTFLSSARVPTTGTKGTLPNVHGIKAALQAALQEASLPQGSLSMVRLNEAAPVIGDTAMETITETVITESSMIGHNPSTPFGAGEAVGELLFLEHIWQGKPGRPYLVVASSKFSYAEVASRVNAHLPELSIVGLLLQADEAVLVGNRLSKPLPIIDEVRQVQKIPEGVLAAIEVALPGTGIRMLSNPYGIATLLHLTPEQTREVTPIAKSLIGKRSAVVIKTPHGNVQENQLPAGKLTFLPEGASPVDVDVDEGAGAIMAALAGAQPLKDIQGEEGTNIGQMLGRIRGGMDSLCEEGEGVRITDLLAVDTLSPVAISGALAGETCMEKAVGIAAMVRTSRLPMRSIARALEEELSVQTQVGGVEAVMASLGALTTPGAALPLAILDMGGGSTDAALLTPEGRVECVHQAGAGELVTMLIQLELGLESRLTAEQIKKYPLAKVESLYHMRLETGQVRFTPEPLDPRYYGRVILLPPSGEYIRLEEDLPMEKILQVRREAKQKVFVQNALRALTQVAPQHQIRRIPNVVLVGGSAEDFEIPEMLTQALSEYRVVCGRGNIRGNMGPRNAVATGLLMAYAGEASHDR